MVVFNSSKGDNVNYRVHISCPGHKVDVVCDMPEQFSFGVTSDWESLLPYRLSSLLGEAVQNIANAIGANAQSKTLSYQTWMGTSPIEFPLQLQFDYQDSALEQVYKPMAFLMAIVAPVNQGELLRAPGPLLGSSDRNYGVHIRIGRHIFFQDCIVTAANATYDTRFDKDGFPIAGEMEVTFRTSTVYGNIDVLKALDINLGA